MFAVLVAACTLGAHQAAAQDTTQKGVRIGLTYQPGTKPGIVVLPIAGDAGDSIRTMLQRDLDFSDRIAIVGAPGSSAAAAVRPVDGSLINYGLWKAQGAAALVQGTLAGGTLRVALHDVAAQRVARTRDIPLPASVGSAEWRLAVHGVSDEVERWITGTRGIAQTRILYVHEGKVYVTDSDGAGERALTSGASALSPAWSPNGQSFAYSQFGEHGMQIMIKDLSSAAARVVPGATRGLNITPAFSPDGKSLLYAHGLENGTDLVLANVAGGGETRRVTLGRGTDNVSPTFSPDGQRIAFTSGRSGHPEVYIADADGSNAELLTPFNFGDQNYRSNPDWSPDGRQIVFQSQIAGRFQIMTITLRNRSLKQLTSEGVNEDASWAPDGRHLVFTSTRTGVKQLWVIDAESGRARQLTRAPGSRLAAWSRYLGVLP